MKNQPFHMVHYSPWSLIGSVGALMFVSSMTMMFHKLSYLLIGLLLLLLIMIQWWRDISRESTFKGLHTNIVVSGLKIGLILFIISEIFFHFFESSFMEVHHQLQSLVCNDLHLMLSHLMQYSFHYLML